MTHPSRPEGRPPSDLAQAVAQHCDIGAWLRFLPRFSRLSIAGGMAGPEPGDWAQWLSQATPAEGVAARRLLLAMSRHRWSMAPANLPPRPQERLQALIRVQGRTWHVALSTTPRLHAVLVDLHPAAQG